MGVKGLWTLLGPVAVPVKLEELRGQRLAIDASIWMYQFVKALRDTTGQPIVNAHILGFVRRLAKLLFYRIRPVFVFDGDVPELKRRVIQQRQQRREGAGNLAEQSRQRAVQAKLKKHAVRTVAASSSSHTGPTTTPQASELVTGQRIKNDEFELPPLPHTSRPAHSGSLEFKDPPVEEGSSAESAEHWSLKNLLELDDESMASLEIDPEFFANLGPELQAEFLAELKSRSRDHRWEHLQEILDQAPTALDFSRMQVQNLVRRNRLWKKMEQVQSNQLQWNGTDPTNLSSCVRVESRKIASNRGREYLLIKNADNATWTIAIDSDQPVEKSESVVIEASSSSHDFPIHETKLENTAPPITDEGANLVRSVANNPVSDSENDEDWIAVDPIKIIESDDEIISGDKDFPRVSKELPLAANEPNLLNNVSLEVIKKDVDVEMVTRKETVEQKQRSFASNLFTDSKADEQKQEEIGHDKTTVSADILSEDHDDDHIDQFLEAAQTEDLGEIDNRLTEELEDLYKVYRKNQRDASITSADMIQDIHELLKLFGIPFITAPMEAEAQCAFLYANGLVDGIITDDSDVFLFGGSRIFKNFFNQSRYVECYTSEAIAEHLGLDRGRLIALAYLLGSDYALGVGKVGPVSGMEILSAFSGYDSNSMELLVSFEKWHNALMSNQITDADQDDYIGALKRTAKHWLIPPEFTDPKIRLAYLRPLVDESLLHFTWALPDLISLRRYLADKLGWDREKTDDMLVPKACAANNDPPPPFPSENFNIILHNRQITLKPKIQAAVARLKASCDGSIESHPELHRAKKRRKI